jgi:hypothetical protein
MHTSRASVVFCSVVVLLLAPASFGAITALSGSLNGASESPSNSSTGIGSTSVVYDSTAHTLTVNVSFSGLTAPTTASHIHCCTTTPGTGTAGVATTTPTFAGFPLGVTSGTYSATLNLTLASSYNPAFITANGGTTASAEAALAAGFANGTSYLNIHTTAFPAGEIRAFLTLGSVPAFSRLAIGLLAALLAITGAALLRRS